MQMVNSDVILSFLRECEELSSSFSLVRAIVRTKAVFRLYGTEGRDRKCEEFSNSYEQSKISYIRVFTSIFF